MNIIRRIDNGVEFFTVESTGESGMSVSGLARLCGVDQSAVTKLTKSVMSKKAPKRLKAFEGKELTLMSSAAYKNVKIYTAEYCAGVVKHYAFEGREEAEFALEKFATDGINLWIQSITGWKKPDSLDIKRLPPWHGMRRSGMDVRKTLTESIEIYKERHPEMSDNKKKFLYKNTTDQLNRQRFGKQAKQLREERGLSKNQPLRDSMSIDELFDVKRIECLAVELILQFDFYPPDAIIEAMNRMLIPMLKAAR